LRKNLLFCTSANTGNVETDLWQGLSELCVEKDISLTTLVGGQFMAKSPSEYMRNHQYLDVDAAPFDSVIVWASNVHLVSSNEDRERFYRHFGGKTLLNLQADVCNKPLLRFNDAKGISDIVRHLVKVHGYRKLAFIRGPETHALANNRYQSFLATAKELDLEINPLLITGPGGWTNRGQAFLSTLIDKHHLVPGEDFDAIVSVNSAIAKEIIKEAKKRDINVPGQIAVTGYNDDREAAIMVPPLTVANPDFNVLGRICGQLSLDLVEGKTFNRITETDVTINIRNSCGCLSKSITDTIFQSGKNEGQEFGKRLRMVNGLPHQDDVQAAFSDCDTLLGKETGRLAEAFLDALATGNPTSFLHRFVDIVGKNAEAGAKTNDLYRVLTRLRYIASKPELAESARTVSLEMIQAMTLVASLQGTNLAELQQLKILRRLESVTAGCLKLANSLDIRTITSILSDILPPLGVSGWHVLTIEADKKYRSLVAGGICPGVIGKDYTLDELLHLVRSENANRTNCVVESLYYQTEAIGVLILCVEVHDGRLLEMLRTQLSSNLKSALLIQNLEESGKVLQNWKIGIEAQIRPMIQTISKLDASIKERNSDMTTLSRTAESGMQKMVDTTKSLSSVDLSLARLKELNDVIDQVANTVRVLSINAAVTAARSGEHGKVFGVIAKEIRQLSDQTNQSATDINRSLDEIIGKIKNSQNIGTQTTETLTSAKEQTDQLVQFLAGLTEALHSLESNSEKILKSMDT